MNVIPTQSDTFDALIKRGVALSDKGHLYEAMQWLRAAKELRPDSAVADWNLGMNLLRGGRWDLAIACYERALSEWPDLPELHRDLAYALLGRGHFERGWLEHEWRLNCPGHPALVVNRPFWRGEDPEGRTILLHYEQGLGDTLQFIRFAPLVNQRGGRVALFCQPSMLRLLARSPGVDLAFDGTSFQPDCHLQTPLLSLPAICRTSLAALPDRVPYLSVDPAVVEEWRLVLAGELGVDIDKAAAGLCAGRSGRPYLIGVAWQGNPKHRFDRWRSFPLAQLAPLADLPGVRLVSLQAEHGREQLRELAGRFRLIELRARRPRDFLDTAAVISLLDLVITADSAVAHLAGGLGARTWVALCAIQEWRWMTDRDDSPWYPTMRLFRQKTPGDWDEVFRRMAGALKQEPALRS